MSNCIGKDGASIRYNNVDQICCSGVVSNRASSHTLCCCKQTYDERTHVCTAETGTCEIKETPKETCHDKLYDPETQVCCHDTGN